MPYPNTTHLRIWLVCFGLNLDKLNIGTNSIDLVYIHRLVELIQLINTPSKHPNGHIQYFITQPLHANANADYKLNLKLLVDLSFLNIGLKKSKVKKVKERL